jgi:2-desacetyl-2-hydroxyethyl bacteriochlorophyllide A dehydrogenase
MLAARWMGPNRLEAAEVPVPDIASGDALVEVQACGFCGSDIGIVSGVHPRARAPLIIGHECSGVIAALGGPAPGFAPGDPVTVFPLISCGHCSACRNGHSHVCAKLRLYGFDIDGAMAGYVRVSAANLVRLPRDLDSRISALIEPLAVAVHAVSRGDWNSESTAAVLGAGPIGLLTALVAKARGVPRVAITDILELRLELARSMGLTAVHADELRTTVDEWTGGEGVDLVFECAGSGATAAAMTSIARPRGVLVNVGVLKKPPAVDLQAVNFKELTIRGSRVYTRHDFEEAVDMAGRLPLRSLVTHTYPLRSAAEAYARFANAGDACKVIVVADAS